MLIKNKMNYTRHWNTAGVNSTKCDTTWSAEIFLICDFTLFVEVDTSEVFPFAVINSLNKS